MYEDQMHSGVFWSAKTESYREKAFASGCAEMNRRGNQYNRGTGCEKIARPGLVGGPGDRPLPQRQRKSALYFFALCYMHCSKLQKY